MMLVLNVFNPNCILSFVFVLVHCCLPEIHGVCCMEGDISSGTLLHNMLLLQGHFLNQVEN